LGEIGRFRKLPYMEMPSETGNLTFGQKLAGARINFYEK
jgi:hypothetical protein